jgi:hypothetical protein
VLIPSSRAHVQSHDELTNIPLSSLSTELRVHNVVMTARRHVNCSCVTMPLCFGSTSGLRTCFEISPSICRVDSVSNDVLQQAGAAVVSPGTDAPCSIPGRMSPRRLGVRLFRVAGQRLKDRKS